MDSSSFDALAEYNHPSWFTSVATVVAYGLILVGMFVVLFVVPYLLFSVVPAAF